MKTSITRTFSTLTADLSIDDTTLHAEFTPATPTTWSAQIDNEVIFAESHTLNNWTIIRGTQTTTPTAHTKGTTIEITTTRTSPDVPSPLQTTYDQLTLINPATALDYQIARAKIAALKPRRRRRLSRRFQLFEAYTAEIIRRHHPPLQPIEIPAFRYARINELLRGVFSLVYWQRIDPTSTDYLVHQPINIPDPNPTPYAYREQTNLPSKVTYGNGVPSISPPRYHGQTIGNYFEDVLLAWARARFELIAPLNSTSFEPLAILIEGSQALSADHRSSRPMLSALAKLYVGPAADPSLSPTDPPIAKAISFYRLYKAPITTSPFYHSAIVRHALAGAETRAHFAPTAPYDHATLTYTVRPMKGHGFNNNTNITTSLENPSAALYMLRPIAAQVQPIAYNANGALLTLDLEHGIWTTRTDNLLLTTVNTNNGLVFATAQSQQGYIYSSDWTTVINITVDARLSLSGFQVRNTPTGWTAFSDARADFSVTAWQDIDFDGTVHDMQTIPDTDPAAEGRARANHRTPNGNWFAAFSFTTLRYYRDDFIKGESSNGPFNAIQFVVSDDAIYSKDFHGSLFKTMFPDLVTNNDATTLEDTLKLTPTEDTNLLNLYPNRTGFEIVHPDQPTRHISPAGVETPGATTTQQHTSTNASTGLTLNL